MTYPESMEQLLKDARTYTSTDADLALAILPVLIEAIEYQYGVIGAIADDKCRARVRHMMRAFGEKGLKAADG